MKKIVLALVAGTSLLTGCIAVEPVGYTSSYGYGPTYGTYGTYYGDRTYSRDRDGDGVPNRWDARPDNPRRY